MLRTSLLGVALLALTMPAEPIQAQETLPTHIVMRYFKCADQGEAVRALQLGRPVVQQMVGEGKFLDYGILSHNWGDEWNVVDYFVVAGIGSFFANFTDLAGRIGAAAAASTDEDAPTLESCTEHKDNIYAWVAPQM